MAEPQLNFRDYLKAAFGLKLRLPLLGHMPLNLLMLSGFGILGLGNAGFWLLGLGVEAAYLLALTGSERFQKVVRAERLALSHATWAERESELLEALDEQHRARYLRIVERGELIGRLQAADGLGTLGVADLNQIRPTVLQLLGMRQRIQKLLAETRREEIEADIAQVKARLAAAAADSALARALEGTLQIQQARLENLENSLRGLQYVNVELERIEKQLTLMAEGASVSRNPEQWSLSIDGMMRTIQGTSQWLADHNELLAPEVAVPPPTMAPPARTPQKH